MTESDARKTVDAVRRFNRFYTARIGAIAERHLRSPYSLAQVRILYEIANRPAPSASDLCRELGLDPGYVSRILDGLRKRGLVARRTSSQDGRRNELRLTARGRREFDKLDRRARDDVSTILDRVPAARRPDLVRAMRAIEEILGETPPSPIVLREPRPGDLGWVVHRHGALYLEEYGWDERFEALVAGIVADYMKRHDAARERCWIAERDGDILGSVFLVKHSQTVGKLRLLLVEPSARGAGVGSRLVDECIAFARRAGYRRVILWTNDVLHAARRIYERKGFRLVKEEPHRMFGPLLVAQTWELSIEGPQREPRGRGDQVHSGGDDLPAPRNGDHRQRRRPRSAAPQRRRRG